MHAASAGVGVFTAEVQIGLSPGGPRGGLVGLGRGRRSGMVAFGRKIFHPWHEGPAARAMTRRPPCLPAAGRRAPCSPACPTATVPSRDLPLCSWVKLCLWQLCSNAVVATLRNARAGKRLWRRLITSGVGPRRSGRPRLLLAQNQYQVKAVMVFSCPDSIGASSCRSIAGFLERVLCAGPVLRSCLAHR